MKGIMRALAFIFLVLTLHASAQPTIANYQSFAIDHKEVVWLQVYHEEPLSSGQIKEKLFDHLGKKVWIKDLKKEDDDLVGEIVNYRPDYKRYGGKFSNTSEIIRNGKWSGRVKISFKEGKYRVFIYGLTYESLQSTTGSGKATIEQHTTSGTLNDFVLNDLRTSFKKKKLKNLDILHFSFKDSFTIKVDQLIDADW